MKKLFKKLFVPSEQKTTIVAYKSWIVRWKSCTSSEYNFRKYEAEIFPSAEDAYKFAKILKESALYLKSSGFNIQVEANQSQLTTQEL